MVRPVRQILSGAAELIGSLEQCHMSIRCPDGGPGGSKRLKFTHTGVGKWVGWTQDLLCKASRLTNIGSDLAPTYFHVCLKT